MRNRKTEYLVEGNCEKALIDALKSDPALVTPGKVVVYNITSKYLSKGLLMTITPGTEIVLVFDTDVDDSVILKKNIQTLEKAGAAYRIITIPQVNNFEDEIVRSTDVRRPAELTGSKTLSDFKTDFIHITNCRSLLEKHRFRMDLLWTQQAKNSFAGITQMSQHIKK